MIRFVTIAAVAMLAAVAPAHAASKFDGTWKVDLKAAQLPTKPSVYAVAGGTYTCSTCLPPVSVPADGAFHSVAGNPYYDEIAITVVDASTMKRATRKAGKPMGESTMIAAADGKTVSYTFIDTSADNGVPITGKSSSARVAAGPAGSHAVSGSWVARPADEVSESGTIFTLALDGDTLRYSTPTGTSYTATVGGAEAPVIGDPGWTSVKVVRSGANALVETDLRDGKPINIYTMKVSADGKKLTVENNDLRRGQKSLDIAYKQ